MLFSNGDQSAATALIQRQTPRVLAHAYRLLGDRSEAEDVTQDARVRLRKMALDCHQGEAKVSTWLYHVVGNFCIDRMRKHRNRPWPLESVPDPADSAQTVDETLQQKARFMALQTALLELPERQRQALILRSIEGLANPEIARIMSTSVEAVESLTSRGKRALTKFLISKQAELGFDND